MSAETVLEKSGTQSLGTSIERRLETVADWVELSPILEVCDRDIGYERRGRRQELWWRQKTSRKPLSATLK